MLNVVPMAGRESEKSCKLGVWLVALHKMSVNKKAAATSRHRECEYGAEEIAFIPNTVGTMRNKRLTYSFEPEQLPLCHVEQLRCAGRQKEQSFASKISNHQDLIISRQHLSAVRISEGLLLLGTGKIPGFFQLYESLHVRNQPPDWEGPMRAW